MDPDDTYDCEPDPMHPERIVMEGFPSADADHLEDALAHLVTSRQHERLAVAIIGTTALRLRQTARKRHNEHLRQLGIARTKRGQSADTDRLAG